MGRDNKIGYFAQECEVMDERERVIDYIKDAAEYVRTSEGLVSASKMLERFLSVQICSIRRLLRFLVVKEEDYTF